MPEDKIPSGMYESTVQGTDGKTYTVAIDIVPKNEFNPKSPMSVAGINVMNEVGGKVSGGQLKLLLPEIKDQLPSEGSRPTLGGKFGAHELPSDLINQAIKQISEQVANSEKSKVTLK